MARSHYWCHLLDENGNPRRYANIYVYTAGTTSPAYVYLEESGGLPQNSTPQLKADRNGRVEFWIGDVSEDRGYPMLQKFKMYWEKGTDSGTVDYLSIHPISPQVVHETTTTWTSAAPTGYWADIQHNLDNDFPLVQCWRLQTSLVESPEKLEIVNANIVRVYFPTNLYKYSVTVVG
jgi:hypothetical protein